MTECGQIRLSREAPVERARPDDAVRCSEPMFIGGGTPPAWSRENRNWPFDPPNRRCEGAQLSTHPPNGHGRAGSPVALVPAAGKARSDY